jgi:Flp pilus assembly protein TadG
MKLKKQKGVAAVEFALILVPMLILCFGMTELGRALYYYNGLEKATRGAVRYLTAQNLASPPTGETAESIRQKAKSLAVCGAEVCAVGAEPLVPGLTLSLVSICDPVGCATTHSNISTTQGGVNLVSVTIGGTDSAAYKFTSVVPWAVPSFEFSPVKTTMASQFF